MSLEAMVQKHAWKSIDVVVGTHTIEFVVFDWDDVKEREEDGETNVWEYFIGWEGDAFKNVTSGAWIPFAAGGMDSGALQDDGGFQEMGHQGMLFAIAADPTHVIYYDHNEGEGYVTLDASVEKLLT